MSPVGVVANAFVPLFRRESQLEQAPQAATPRKRSLLRAANALRDRAGIAPVRPENERARRRVPAAMLLVALLFDLLVTAILTFGLTGPAATAATLAANKIYSAPAATASTAPKQTTTQPAGQLAPCPAARAAR